MKPFRPHTAIGIDQYHTTIFIQDMNFFSKVERLPRLTNEETKELVRKNPVLRNLFPKKGVVWHCSQDTLMEGFLTSSRFINPELSLNHKSTKVTTAHEENVDDDSDIDSTFTSDHNVNQTSHKDQKRKFAISLATLSAKPYKRSTIIKDGGIKTLLELSNISDSIVRKSCAIAFALLSKEQSLRSRMIEDNVISALISLSSSHNYYIKTNCCKALCNIFCEPGSEPKGVREGAPQALIRIAAICPDSIDLCLKALVNLSCVTDKFVRIEELNEVLFYFNDAAILNDSQKLLLLSVLCNLSAVRNNQLRLVEDGCLRIVDWAWSSTNPQMRIRGSEIIRNLTTEYRSRGKLVENNLINILLAMANDILEEVKICAVKALYILSKDVSCRHKIVTSNGMEVLVMLSMATYQNIEIGRTTARVWRILCKDKNAASKAVNFGVVKAFLSLFSSSSDDQYIQQYIIESICMLMSSQESNIIELLVNDNILSVIVQLIKTCKDTITSEWLAYSLYQLTSAYLTNISTRDNNIIENGILPSLSELSCSPLSSENTKCISSGCYVNITLMKDVDSSAAIPVIVYLLRNELNMITRMNCSTSLYNLSYDDDNCYKMLDAGVLMPIVEFVVNSDKEETSEMINKLGRQSRPSHTSHGTLIQSDSAATSPHPATVSFHRSSLVPLPPEQDAKDIKTSNNSSNSTSKLKDLIRTKIKCAAILSRLTLFEKYYHLFINNHHDVQLLHVLLKLSVVDDVPTQRRIVFSLANLTKNPFLRTKLLSLNPISYILSLASKRDEKLWYGCCSIICNLSFEYGSERLMVQGGIVPTLLITALINTDSMSSKIICAKAISNLLTLPPKDYQMDVSDENKKGNAVKEKKSKPHRENTDEEEYYEEDDDEEYDEYEEDEDHDESYDYEETYLFIKSSMVQDRVIWGLSSLALLDNFELLSISAKILNRLSYDHARDIMESAAAVKALIKIINYSDDLELLRLGGEMLINILLKTTRGSTMLTSRPVHHENAHEKGNPSQSLSKRDHSFRNHIVQHMKALASSDDPEVIKSCILSLYLISQVDPICCKTIVSAGMLKMITHSTCNKTVLFSSTEISLAFLNLINNIAKSLSGSSTTSCSSPIKGLASPSNAAAFSASNDEPNGQHNHEIFQALLDDEILSQFHQIIDLGDEKLDMTAVRGLYVFTCHQENIEKLAHEKHGILCIINRIWTRKTYVKSLELIEHLVAILFNMSIYPAIQGSMVSQGIVTTFVSIWTYVHEKAYLDESMISTVTNYALSTANTATANANSANNSANATNSSNSNGSGGNAVALSNSLGNRSSLIKMQPSSAYKVYKPVAGLPILSMSSPSGQSVVNGVGGRPIMRLSFSPTSSSFYAISNSTLNNGSFISGYNSVSTLNIGLSGQTAYSSLTSNPLADPSAQALQILANHQIYMRLCILICSAISHLGCGNVNSAKMIENGCAPILVFITQSYKQAAYLNYIFDYGVYHRCSAAIRNLLLNICNQAIMIQHGCLQGLIDLFTLVTRAEQQSIAVETTATTTTGTAGSNPSGVSNVIVNNTNQLNNSNNIVNQSRNTNRSEKQTRIMICKNCASGLRSLTYNSEERDSIITSGAINVILSDLKDELADDETSIDAHLLHEIEAESWQNGIRRHQREERAKPIPPENPFLDYLIVDQSKTSVLDIPLQCSHLMVKYHITTIESYEEERQSQSANANQSDRLIPSSQHLDDTIAVVNIKVSDLVSYEESDDTSHAIPQQYPKLEIDISEENALIELKSNDRNDRNDIHTINNSIEEKSSIVYERNNTNSFANMSELLENSLYEGPSSRVGTASAGDSRGIDSLIEENSQINQSRNGKSQGQGQGQGQGPNSKPPNISEFANAKSTKFNDLPKLSGAFSSPRLNSEGYVSPGTRDPDSKLMKSKQTGQSTEKSKKSIHKLGNQYKLTPIKITHKKLAERVNVRRAIQPHDKFSEIVAKINSREANKQQDNDLSSINEVLGDWKSLCGRK